jgi:ABC-type antimicrobial peptide transport system permease subunit
VATLQERIDRATLRTRFSATLLGLFAAVAVALATLGVYGVISFSVLQRTREIGIRSALGAARGNLLGLVVGQGARFFVVGAVVGVGVALGSNRVLSSLLYGVAPTDPSTLGFIVVLLGVAVLAASWIPARRAARIDPMAALRDE